MPPILNTNKMYYNFPYIWNLLKIHVYVYEFSFLSAYIYIKDIEVSYFCNLKLGYRIFFNHCLSSLILIRIEHLPTI